ncbi:MAG: hypothetical protein JXB29_11975 [Sedimentisphaerales bacterium]|nr:hypothetical protein [Sedimentisphaerales bacterium]
MAKRKQKLRICLAASAGGHVSQLLKLASSWEGHETVCIVTTDVVRNRLAELGRVYVVGECNHRYPLRVMKVLLRCIRAILREYPDVLISTGAAVGCIACFLGKLIGAKVIWIESIANVEGLSLSGKMVRPIANLFIVQWPQIAEQYSNVEYLGALI